MTVPGINSYYGLLNHAEIREIHRFHRAEEVVSYAGSGPGHPGVRRFKERG